jgi:hypothetical protein
MKKLILSLLLLLLATPSFGQVVLRPWGSNPDQSLNTSDSPAFAGLTVAGQIYDVREYGAVCDGATDDATAIQAAITAARTTNSGAVVRLPWGKCHLDSTVNLDDGVVLEGSSKWYSGLVADSDITLLSTNGQSYTHVRNMKIEGPAEGTGTGIEIDANSHQAIVENVYFEKLNYGVTVAWDSAFLSAVSSYTVAYPIYANHTAHNLTILNPNLDDGTRGIWLGATAASRNMRIYGGMVQNFSDIGIQVAGYAADVIIDGTYFEGNTTYDIGTDNNPTNLIIRGTSSSSQPTDHIHIDSSGGTTIIAPRFSANPTNDCISINSSARGVLIVEPIYTGITAGKEIAIHGSATYSMLDDRTFTTLNVRAGDIYANAAGSDPSSGAGIRLKGGSSPIMYWYDYGGSAWLDGTIYSGQLTILPQSAVLKLGSDLYPNTDNTYYLGKNDDDTPFAYKGLILKDQTTGTYYRLQIDDGSVALIDLTD